ncbi:bacterio-opsin activator domain-containing protein [Natrialbaceae archaeon A-arb3/5]
MSNPPSDQSDSSNGMDVDEADVDGADVDWLSDVSFDVRELTGLVSDYAVSLLDADGHIVTWNNGERSITGYEADEIVGAHYRVLFPTPIQENGRPERLLERARTTGQAEDEGWRIRSDGSRFWVREVLAPIRDEDGLDADSNAEDGDLQGYAWFVHDRTDERERERELREEKALTESIFEAQPDILYAYDTEGNLIHWNDRFEDAIGYDADDLAGMHPLKFIAPADREHIGRAIERILEEGESITAEGEVLTKDGRQVPYEFNSARITDETGTVLGFTGVGRNISDRKARERELERLERLNAIVRTIDEAMIGAETREEIETAIVEAFAAADAYRFAVIGRVDAAVTTDRVSWEPKAWAGVDATLNEGVLSSFVDPPADAPGASPLETGAVQRYRSLREHSIETWRTDARERGYGSVATVPIVASGRTFGVLLIAAADPSAFTDREQEVLREFGGTVGHAINAMTVRRLLYMDTVVELEFESRDRKDVCIDLSARADCRLTLDHVLALTDEVFVYYVTVSDVGADRIRDIVRDHPSIREFRPLEDTGDESHLELVVRGPTVTGLLADHGARMRSNVVDHGVANAVVQVSPDADVRELVDAITSTYPETKLVSKRSVDQPVETHSDFRRAVDASLTEKQRTALEAAYYGGYFEWPTRNSDASEIADRLGIARQTFHQHLRVAQEKLLMEYFE